MAYFKEELKLVKAFIFDVDGVLSMDTTPLNAEGDPVRTANVKDGFAIRNALRNGFEIAIITGGFVERVKLRHQKLGVKYYYENINSKLECLDDFVKNTGIGYQNILYMGDDLVDYQIMKKVGMPTCPLDAVQEIKEISKYISDKKGGEGCVRDVIEQVLRVQGKWMNSDAYYLRSS
ncbi:MAG: HAD hydrolase family protein [Prolixibacteraceae bacterium]|nr:HAD hydrolase family protein [Prolixibacteraceae bacterium]